MRLVVVILSLSLGCNPGASAAPVQPFVVVTAPLPPVESTRGEVLHDEQGGAWETHRLEGQVYWLYVPSGEPPTEGWPAVIVPPAGTNLLMGMTLAAGDQAEHLPYLEAGYVVVSFDLPGGVPTAPEGTATDEEFVAGYKAFKADSAGVGTAARAFEWLSHRVPHVNVSRIFVAGHSSAGTLSLLYCAHEPRLAGCVAYAPVADFASHRSRADIVALARMGFEGIAEFVPRSSPVNYTGAVGPPLFVFYAQDDRLAAEDAEYVRRARAAGRRVDVKTVAVGGHYQPMIEIGIPAGIAWMNTIQK